MRQLAIAAAPAAGAGAGCGGGGGQPSTWAGSSEYDAAASARSAISDEEIDPTSIAYRRKLLVGEGTVDHLPGDGRQAWRIGFTTLDGAASTICIWVWVSKSVAFQQTFAYSIDKCPVTTGA